MQMLDMRGNPCPIPVVMTKKALAESECNGVTVMVDNPIAVQNLHKMAKGEGFDFSFDKVEEDYCVTITKPSSFPFLSTKPNAAIYDNKNDTDEGVIVLITRDHMGSGDETLGKILIKGFVFSLTELDLAPKAIILLNGGVRLAVLGSNAVDDLQRLQEKGTEIIACGTCLNFFALTDKLAVGSTIDMLGITKRISGALSVITI